jgi:hypothetical protein
LPFDTHIDFRYLLTKAPHHHPFFHFVLLGSDKKAPKVQAVVWYQLPKSKALALTISYGLASHVAHVALPQYLELKSSAVIISPL